MIGSPPYAHSPRWVSSSIAPAAASFLDRAMTATCRTEPLESVAVTEQTLSCTPGLYHFRLLFSTPQFVFAYALFSELGAAGSAAVLTRVNGDRLQRRQAEMRDRINGKPSAVADLPLERHFRPAEIAELWAMSHSAVIALFANESGVLILDRPEQRNKRSYRTLYIPESVLRRVHSRLRR
jgi:hypothetical protein